MKSIMRGRRVIQKAALLALPTALNILTPSSVFAPSLSFDGRSDPQREVAAEKLGQLTLFMCGDVMTGRGIDQVLPHPSDPVIYEPYIRSASGYVDIAEEANGPIPRPVDFFYVWGDALDDFKTMRPDVRIINLETAVTKSEDYFDKGINYRMNPENIPALTAAKIDVCVLANNHVLDWGEMGLAAIKPCCSLTPFCSSCITLTATAEIGSCEDGRAYHSL